MEITFYIILVCFSMILRASEVLFQSRALSRNLLSAIERIFIYALQFYAKAFICVNGACALFAMIPLYLQLIMAKALLKRGLC